MNCLQSMQKSEFLQEELILEEKDGLMRFAHLTYSDVVASILKNGFIAGDGNLGIGVYCCNLDNALSVNSLINFHDDLAEGEDEMSIIAGYYNGKRFECIDSTDPYMLFNKGFVLLTDTNQITITKVHTIPVEQIPLVLKSLFNRSKFDTFQS